MKKIFTIGLMLIACVSVNAITEGKALIEQYINKVNKFQDVKGSKVYFMDITLRTKDWSASGNAKESRFSVSMSKNIYVYESSSAQVYRDADHSYVVLPQMKKILKSEGGFGKVTAEGIKEMTDKQQEVLKNGTVISNKIIEEGKQKVVLQMNETFQKSEMINKVEFVFDTKKNSILKFRVLFTKGASNSLMEMTYHEMSFNKTVSLKSNAKSYLFNGNAIKNKFAGYSIIDQN